MKLLGFDDGSACGFYRLLLPFAELARHGHQAKVRFGFTPPDGDEDVIVAERIDNDQALATWRRLRARSKLAFEVDDDVFSVDLVNWLAWRTYSRAVPRDVVAHAAQVADLVTVTCEPLAEVMRRETGNRNVAVLPNCVPDDLLAVERPRRERLTVGWAGGASHGADLQLVARPLRRFLERTPHADLHLIGTDFRPTIGAPAGRARWTDWQASPWRYYQQVDFDVGLAPLADTPFAASKSPIKALEYAALGIPVVASAVGPYPGFVLDGVTGFLVRQDHEWGRYLRLLASDAGLRAEMGAKAREHAAAFTIGRNWQRWERAYQSIL